MTATAASPVLLHLLVLLLLFVIGTGSVSSSAAAQGHQEISFEDGARVVDDNDVVEGRRRRNLKTGKDYDTEKGKKKTCSDVKKGTTTSVDDPLYDSQSSEGDATKYGERYMWTSPFDSGICTVIAEANATGFVTQLCQLQFDFDDYETKDGKPSTMAASGLYRTNWPVGDGTGSGSFIILGGTGCYAGVSGVVTQTYAPDLDKWVTTIDIE